MGDPEHFDFSGVAAADVVFVCPRGDQGSFHIKVSSSIVRNCSPVFCALLGPHFREGTTLAASHFVTIDLPDDEAEAMKLLFAIMHSKYYGLERDISLTALKSLAIVVDKYDCAETVASLACLWITRRMPSDQTLNTSDLATLLHCAYLFREHEMFELIAHKLLRDSKEPIRGEPGVLVEIYSALETERMRVLMDVSSYVQARIQRACNHKTILNNGCTAECPAQDIYGAAVVRHLDSLNLFPIVPSSKKSVQSILDSMRLVRLKDIKVPAACRFKYDPESDCLAYGQGARAAKTQSALIEKANTLDKSIKQMCLLCVLQGSVLEPSKCLHKNTQRTFGAT